MSDPYAAPNVPQLLGLLEDGDLNAEMANQYRGLIGDMENAAIDTNGKTKVKGKIVITLDFALVGGVYEVEGALKVTAPKRTSRRTVMYGTDGNTLSRTNPRQDDMFLRETPKAKSRTV